MTVRDMVIDEQAAVNDPFAPGWHTADTIEKFKPGKFSLQLGLLLALHKIRNWVSSVTTFQIASSLFSSSPINFAHCQPGVVFFLPALGASFPEPLVPRDVLRKAM